MLNGWEIILIFTLALILFGAKKLPELARGLGQGIREFKKATQGVSEEIEHNLLSEPKKADRLPQKTATVESTDHSERSSTDHSSL